jgi:hypothetical protein
MQPIGLTIKLTRKKYGTGQGELMLIHTCRECKTLSINRIAADDDPQIVFAVGEHSCRIEGATLDHLEDFGIRLLGEADHSLIRVQLFGDETSLAGNLFYESIIETG